MDLRCPELYPVDFLYQFWIHLHLKDTLALSARVLDQRVVTFDFSTMQRANFPSEHFKEWKMLPTIWPENQFWFGLGCLVRDSSCSEAEA